VRRGGRESDGSWMREERLAGNKLGKKLLEFYKRLVFFFPIVFKNPQSLSSNFLPNIHLCGLNKSVA
jgi:hypothetical protein